MNKRRLKQIEKKKTEKCDPSNASVDWVNSSALFNFRSVPLQFDSIERNLNGNLTQIEQERNGNGTELQRDWNGNGTGMELEWSGNGIGMEREWNGTGMERK